MFCCFFPSIFHEAITEPQHQICLRCYSPPVQTLQSQIQGRFSQFSRSDAGAKNTPKTVQTDQLNVGGGSASRSGEGTRAERGQEAALWDRRRCQQSSARSLDSPDRLRSVERPRRCANEVRNAAFWRTSGIMWPDSVGKLLFFCENNYGKSESGRRPLPPKRGPAVLRDSLRRLVIRLAL